jgi:hypothetical protein
MNISINGIQKYDQFQKYELSKNRKIPSLENLGNLKLPFGSSLLPLHDIKQCMSREIMGN